MKVHLSCRSHPRYGHVFEDPSSRGIAWGLWFLAVQYHAAQTDNEVTLGLGDLVWLTGRAQRAPALNALRTVCERLEYPVLEVGKRIVVKIRNLKQKQGFDSAISGDTPQTPHPSEEPKNQRTKEHSSDSASRRSGRSAADAAPRVENPSRPNGPPKPARASPPAWALRCASTLIELLRPVPGARIPRGAETRWAAEIEALGREAPELAAMDDAGLEARMDAAIRWSLGPDNLGRPYEVLIRSGGALREKWPKLVAAAQRKQARTVDPADLAARAMAIREAREAGR